MQDSIKEARQRLQTHANLEKKTFLTEVKLGLFLHLNVRESQNQSISTLQNVNQWAIAYFYNPQHSLDHSRYVQQY